MCAETPLPAKCEQSWQWLMLPRVGTGDLKETGHAGAAANTALL